MSEVLTVYHGSKNGLEGPIRMVAGRNRQTCDFGQGFYMGDEPTQPRTLICDGTRPTLYTLSLDLDGLIGVPALVKCLSVLNVGNQYCAISRKAFSRISIVSEKRFSSRECELFRAKSERQRRRAVSAADEICVSMRREGEGFLDLVRKRMGKNGEAVSRPLRSGKGKTTR